MTYMRDGDVWHILRSTSPSEAYCGRIWRFDDMTTEITPDKVHLCKRCREFAQKAGLKVR